MPKITNKEYEVAGQTYPCQVWYTTSNKFFLKDFPRNVEIVAGITPLGSLTEKELYERYEKGIETYEDIIAKSKKVIVFKINAAKPHFKERFSRYGDNKFPAGVSDSNGDKMGFIIDYDIKFIRQVGEASYLQDIDKDGKPYGSGSEIRNISYYKIIDYTEERERVFKDLYERFDKMLMMFVEGFNDAEKFIDSIQSANLLLN